MGYRVVIELIHPRRRMHTAGHTKNKLQLPNSLLLHLRTLFHETENTNASQLFLSLSLSLSLKSNKLEDPGEENTWYPTIPIRVHLRSPDNHARYSNIHGHTQRECGNLRVHLFTACHHGENKTQQNITH